MLPEKKDLVEYGKGLLKSQWKDKKGVTGLLESYIHPLQEVEDTAEYYKNLSIYNAVGDDLDRIGHLFGVFRKGRDDSAYRRVILAYISATEPKCSIDGIITACKVYGDTDLVDLWEHFPAHQEVYMGSGFSPDMWSICKDMVAAATSVCVLIDSNRDSLVMAEESPVGQTLISSDGDVYTLENVAGEPAKWQVSSLGDYIEVYAGKSQLAEEGDAEWNPLAEELFSEVLYDVGYIVDESGDNLVDENENKIVYTDFRFR